MTAPHPLDPGLLLTSHIPAAVSVTQHSMTQHSSSDALTTPIPLTPPPNEPNGAHFRDWHQPTPGNELNIAGARE